MSEVIQMCESSCTLVFNLHSIFNIGTKEFYTNISILAKAKLLETTRKEFREKPDSEGNPS